MWFQPHPYQPHPYQPHPYQPHSYLPRTRTNTKEPFLVFGSAPALLEQKSYASVESLQIKQLLEHKLRDYFQINAFSDRWWWSEKKSPPQRKATGKELHLVSGESTGRLDAARPDPQDVNISFFRHLL